MAKKKGLLKKFFLFNQDVTSVFSSLLNLNESDNDGFSIDKMMGDIEEARKKKNFSEAFLNIYNKNFDKVLKSQSNKIKDGTSKETLAEVAKKYVEAMLKVEEICMDKKLLNKSVIKDASSQNKTKESLKEALNKEFALNKDPKVGEKLKKQLKDVLKAKLTDDALNKKLPTPKTTFQDVVMQVAEKKFGPLNLKNQKDIDAYVRNFNIKEEKYRKDLEEYSDMKVDALTANGWTINNRMNPLGGYYIDPYDRAALDILSRHMEAAKMSGFTSALMGIPTTGNPKTDNYHWGLLAAHLDTKPLTLPDPPEAVEEKISAKVKPDDAFAQFRNKHGININKELINDILTETDNMTEGKEVFYKKGYMETFVRLFDKVDTSKSKIAEVAEDYEKCMQQAIKESHPELAGEEFKYGGLKPEELKDFLQNLNEVDCNLTKRSKKELMDSCTKEGNKIDVKDAIKFSKDKVDEDLSTELPKEVQLANAVGRLSALQQIHQERGKSFKFFHPFDNKKEKDAIKELKQSIVDLQGGMTKEIEDAVNGKEVFKPGYEENKQGIETLVSNISRNSIANLDKNTDVTLGVNNPNVELSKAKEITNEPVQKIEEPHIDALSNMNNPGSNY